MDGHLLRFDKNVTYALIDLETFNLNLSFVQNRPWQVGVLKVKGETVVESHDLRINLRWPDAPHLKIGEGAAMVTRFNEEYHNRFARPAEEVFQTFWPILKEADYIIMHNGLKFDLYLLRDYAKYVGEDWKFITPKVIDTKSIAQGIKMGIKFNPKNETFMEYQYKMANIYAHGVKTRLEILGKEFGIEHDYEHLHDAIVDLQLNLKVWNKLKTQIEL
jgi:DNA polymerase III epsilon subunit-like protein